MKKLAVPYQRMKPGRYASELRKLVRNHEPKRKLDLMVVHALIEARSCERFRLLAKRLPEQVRDLYEQLERSEARHFELYLDFAGREFEADEIAERLEIIAARFDRATDVTGQFAAMRELEELSFDEMVSFLKSNAEAKFVM